MITKRILFMGQNATIACDARCDKAWGRQTRKFLPDGLPAADDDLGEAPADPGTREGLGSLDECAKPTRPSTRLNRWCARECERCWISPPGHPNATPALPTFDKSPQTRRAQAKGREEDALVHHLLREPLTPAGVKAAFAPLIERARGKGTFPFSRRDSDAFRYLDNARRAALYRAALLAEFAAQKARADQHDPKTGDDPDDLWRQVRVATRVMQDQLLLARLAREP